MSAKMSALTSRQTEIAQFLESSDMSPVRPSAKSVKVALIRAQENRLFSGTLHDKWCEVADLSSLLDFLAPRKSPTFEDFRKMRSATTSGQVPFRMNKVMAQFGSYFGE